MSRRHLLCVHIICYIISISITQKTLDPAAYISMMHKTMDLATYIIILPANTDFLSYMLIKNWQ
jgi:hypothetical protein